MPPFFKKDIPTTVDLSKYLAREGSGEESKLLCIRIRNIIEQLIKNKIESETLSPGVSYPVKVNGKKLSYQLTKPIQFLCLDKLSPEHQKLLNRLITQELVTEEARQKNKFRLLPYTLYKLTDEPEQFIVLSQEIDAVPAETQSIADRPQTMLWYYAVIEEKVRYVHFGDNENKRQPTFIIKTPPDGYASIYTTSTKGVSEKEINKANYYSPWGFYLTAESVQYVQKRNMIKSYYIQNSAYLEEKTKQEQLFNDLIYGEELIKRKPVIIKDAAGITEIRVTMNYLDGIALGQYPYEIFNYGEALTIAMRAVAMLREIYHCLGPEFIHGDLNDANIQYNRNYNWADNNTRVISIVDFADSGKIGDERPTFGVLSSNPHWEGEKKFEQIYGSKEDPTIKKSKLQDLKAQYPDLQFHIGLLSDDLEEIHDGINQGIDEKNTEEAKLFFAQAKAKLETLLETLSGYPIVEFSQFSMEYIFEFEKLIIFLHKIRKDEYDNFLNHFNIISASKTDNFDSLNKIQLNINEIKKILHPILIPGAILNNDLYFLRFCQQFARYQTFRYCKSTEILQGDFDTRQLGSTFQDLFTKCQYSDSENKSPSQDVHTTIMEMVNGKIKNDETLNKAQLSFCVALLEQLEIDINKIRIVIQKDIETLASLKKRYAKKGVGKKLSACTSLHDIYQAQLINLNDLLISILLLLPTARKYQNGSDPLSYEKVTELVENIRSEQHRYDNIYLAIHEATKDSALSVLDERRWGFKSFTGITRPISFILGGILNLAGADKYRWCKFGFFCTRSKSLQEKMKIRDNLEESSKKSQTLSPKAYKTIFEKPPSPSI